MGNPCSQNSTPAVPITSKPHLDVFTVTAILYAVAENHDYHITAQDIVDLVKLSINRTSLSINNTDNTSDVDKPISSLQQQEFTRIQQIIDQLLSDKADKNNVPTISQHNALVDEVATCVKKIPYDIQIQEILDMIAALSGLTEADVNVLIDAKLVTPLQNISTINQVLAGLELEYVTRAEFNTYTQAVALEFQRVDQAAAAHEARITAIENQLSNFVTSVGNQW